MAKIDIDMLAGLRLGHGDSSPDPCLMQAISHITGFTATLNRRSDQPPCVSTLLTTFGVRLNDRAFYGDRQLLKARIPRLIGTADDLDAEDARVFLLMDIMVHELSLKAEDQRVRDLSSWCPRVTTVDDARAIKMGMETRYGGGACDEIYPIYASTKHLTSKVTPLGKQEPARPGHWGSHIASMSFGLRAPDTTTMGGLWVSSEWLDRLAIFDRLIAVGETPLDLDAAATGAADARELVAV